MKPDKLQRSKDAKIFLGRSRPCASFVYAHALRLNYVTETTFLLISSDRIEQRLCFVHGQGQTTYKPYKHESEESTCPEVHN